MHATTAATERDGEADHHPLLATLFECMQQVQQLTEAVKQSNIHYSEVDLNACNKCNNWQRRSSRATGITATLIWMHAASALTHRQWRRATSITLKLIWMHAKLQQLTKVGKQSKIHYSEAELNVCNKCNNWQRWWSRATGVTVTLIWMHTSAATDRGGEAGQHVLLWVYLNGSNKCNNW